MMHSNIRIELDELLYLTLENSASPEQVRRLDSLLESDPEAVRYAADFYFITASLRKSNAIPSASFATDHEINEQRSLLMELAHEEKTAPVLEIPQVDERPERIQPVSKHQNSPTASRLNRVSVVMAVTSLAALLMLIAYVRTVPPRESVAVLVDAIDAQWANTSETIQTGHLFYNNEGPLLVKSGMIEIEFDYGARVVIEGPCEFSCKADNLIYLDYGRLYARVPEEATGFTVDTRTARIVDMGTEFAVQENIDQTTEVHVLKGRTTLLAGRDNEKTAFEVVEGQARQVTDNGGTVREIGLKDNAFVQQIHSRTRMIRKGQNVVDLADIAGGGNGFGTGQRNVGLDPLTARIARITESNRTADNIYRAYRPNPFIDGVFVPNGQTPQVITSAGHIFTECPVTRGNFYTEIANAPATVDNAEIVLGDINYSRSQTGSLFLHANLGITFDLQAIREQMAEVKVSRFQSVVGVCDTAWRPCNADIWVLVDGQVRYSRRNVQRKGVLDTLDIQLTDQDRFLTLVATDGGDPDNRTYETMSVTSMDSDWCLFARPVLVLE